MDMTPASLLLAALTALAGFGTAYLRQRSENLATRHDIADITQRVEAVKASVHVLRESQLTSLRQRHDALLAFYDVATALAVERLPRRFADFKDDDGADLGEHLAAVAALFDRVQITFHRLLLYFPEGHVVVETAGALVQVTRRLKRDYGSAFAGAHIAFVGAARNLDSGSATALAQEKADAYVAAVAGSLIRLDEAYRAHVRAARTYLADPDHSSTATPHSAAEDAPATS